MVQCKLEYATLKSVTEATEIWYDPDPTDTVIEEDKDLVSLYFEMPDNEEISNISPWLLRIILKKEMMLDKRLNMSKVAN